MSLNVLDRDIEAKCQGSSTSSEGVEPKSLAVNPMEVRVLDKMVLTCNWVKIVSFPYACRRTWVLVNTRGKH